MTTVWTSKSLGVDPPRSILSFYGRTDFKSGIFLRSEATTSLAPDIRLPSTNCIRHINSITSYGDDEDGTCGWAMRPGDPRSELVRSLFNSGHGLSLLLNNVVNTNDDDDEEGNRRLRATPTPERVAAVSPLAHVRAGD
ncbi:hypothetical protein F4779DRAFT_613455 [Xylariaceae sp. FL0662B]|nr:hypothetical protein F4779DRAFT_613455 [Xylariaceae sp. FL0662B]